MRMTLRRFGSGKKLGGVILFLLGRLFRRERLYDFLEARIAAERVPSRVQF
jgi:hypothetical protein